MWSRSQINSELNGVDSSADLDRDGDDAMLRLELPAVDPEKDVVVELDRGRLVVRGERHE